MLAEVYAPIDFRLTADSSVGSKSILEQSIGIEGTLMA
jgi:hypothetical protein